MSNTSFVIAPIAHGTTLGASERAVEGLYSTSSAEGAVRMIRNEIITRNPAPDASPPTSPARSHRDVVICR
jgi:hypothetical protein